MRLRICIFGFGSQYLDLQVWVSGFGTVGLSQDLISAFVSEDLDVWVCVSGSGPTGMGLRIGISGFGSQDLDL